MRYEGKTREEAFHLVKARHWSLGHSVILRSLVSDAIINGKTQIYEQYSIESFGEKRSDVIP